jgi:hypothetical protein
MAEARGLRRRFVTRVDVEDAARAGVGITLGPTDVLTDEARSRARDLRVVVSVTGAGSGVGVGAGAWVSAWRRVAGSAISSVSSGGAGPRHEAMPELRRSARAPVVQALAARALVVRAPGHRCGTACRRPSSPSWVTLTTGWSRPSKPSSLAGASANWFGLRPGSGRRTDAARPIPALRWGRARP